MSGHATIEAQSGKGHRPVRLLSGLGRRPGLLSERKCSPDGFHPLALLLGLPTGSVLREIHLRVFVGCVCRAVGACAAQVGGDGEGPSPWVLFQRQANRASGSLR